MIANQSYNVMKDNMKEVQWKKDKRKKKTLEFGAGHVMI